MTKIERDRSILLKLKIICSEKNGIFYAEIIDIPGCKVKGNSLEELKRNISKKIKM